MTKEKTYKNKKKVIEQLLTTITAQMAILNEAIVSISQDYTGSDQDLWDKIKNKSNVLQCVTKKGDLILPYVGRDFPRYEVRFSYDCTATFYCNGNKNGIRKKYCDDCKSKKLAFRQFVAKDKKAMAEFRRTL
tara:strand:+ start:280 stop:678 length:399 start_codon:yes stop_codon:yes gene_type:complete